MKPKPSDPLSSPIHRPGSRRWESGGSRRHEKANSGSQEIPCCLSIFLQKLTSFTAQQVICSVMNSTARPEPAGQHFQIPKKAEKGT